MLYNAALTLCDVNTALQAATLLCDPTTAEGGPGQCLRGVKFCVVLGQMVHFAYEAEELAARREVHQKVQVLLCLHTQVSRIEGSVDAFGRAVKDCSTGGTAEGQGRTRARELGRARALSAIGERETGIGLVRGGVEPGKQRVAL